jgi:hypothetical protein
MVDKRLSGRDQSSLSKTSQKEVEPGSAKKWHTRFTEQSGIDSNQSVECCLLGALQQVGDRIKGWFSCNNLDLVDITIKDVKKIPNGFGKSKCQDTGVSEASMGDKSEATGSSREVALLDILDNVKPVLPDGVKEHLDVVIKYHKKGAENKLSGDEYIEAYKQALKNWCPDIWKKYENVDFVTSREWDYAKPKYKDKDGKWMFYLPSKTDYPKDILLRSVDETLTIKYDDILRNHQNFNADLEMRVNIMAKTLEMNMELGDRGWKVTEEYPLAYQYKKDYENGICQAFDNGLINITTSKDEVRQIGYNYAREKLRECSESKDDVPDSFLNTLPGSYFEEWDRFTKMERKVELKEPLQLDKDGPLQLDKDGPIKISEDGQTLSMTGPVKLGSDECKILLKFLDARIKEGGKEGTLKVVILPNKEIWVLPYRFSGKEKTKHSIAAMGNSVVWAGEVDMAIDGEGKAEVTKPKVTALKGDSGHYRTYNSDPKKQKAIFQFAVSTFRDHGCDTSDVNDVSLMGLRHKENQTTNEIKHELSRE